MINGRVTGVRSIELGVRDLHQSAEFYTKIWALEEVASEGDSHPFPRDRRRASCAHHPRAAEAEPARRAFRRHRSRRGRPALRQGEGLRRQGRGRAGTALRQRRRRLRLPLHDARRPADEHLVATACSIPNVVLDRSRPTKISHVVLNSAKTDDQVPFFVDVLGFKLSDSSHMMEFLRCSADHHSIAIFRNNGPSLNHVAYELPNIDGLMRGTGRVKKNGFDIEWGIGRHGPGSNVFSYFIEPNGFVAEYTTELDQLDDATHVPQDADYWQKVVPGPDRWGTAGPPSNRMRFAMSGGMYLGEEPPEGVRCEDIIGRKLG